MFLCHAVVLLFYYFVFIIIIIIIIIIIVFVVVNFLFCLCMCVGTCALSLIFKLRKSMKTFNNILKLPDSNLRLSRSSFFYHFSGKRWGLGFGLRFLT